MGKVNTSRLYLALVSMLAVSTLAADAWSQPAADLARARERFKEGAALQAAGDFTRALEVYKEVALVKSSAQVRFNIATCEEKLGDYLKAMGSYRLALSEATQSNAKDIEAAVQKALADLEPRIPTLLVRRGQGAAVAEITLDGRPLANPSIGTQFQVNPGPHSLRATAPDREPATVEITLSDKDHNVVEIVLKPKFVPVVPVKEELPPEPPPEPPPPPPAKRKLAIAGGVSIGLGGVGLVISGAFFGLRQKAISTLDAECGTDRQHCPATALPTRDSGNKDATISGATLGVGLGLVAVGGGLLIVSTRMTPPQTPQPAVGLVVMPGGGGLAGVF
jgi:hypothetical protein